jgi:asparagine synthase (glutamine-hydrolysing)
MCGIAAAVGPEAPSRQSLAAALDVLNHRGPDDVGDFAQRDVWLGSRRLAIQDLTNAGHMPMESDGVVITYNGEIYNYVELRRDLTARGHRFHSGTDTEVLLRAYLEWGEGCLDRLNGMWSFVIWDNRTNSAFVARDRFGVKPLYYYSNSRVTIFASEPKFILTAVAGTRRPNADAIYRLLAEKRIDLSRESFYQDVRVFPAASSCRLTPSDVSVRPRLYWEPPVGSNGEISIEDGEQQFAELFDDSVRLRLRSDVSVGVTLSGGLDSTAVLASLEHADPDRPLHAFTSVYGSAPGRDELAWATRASQPYRSVQLHRVPSDVADWLDRLTTIVWHMDSPGLSPAVVPLWEIMATARRMDVPVLLEGQGADELLGGYAHHRAHAVHDLWRDAVRSPSLGGAQRVLNAFRSAVASNGFRRSAIDAVTVAAPRATVLRNRVTGAAQALDSSFAAEMSHRASASEDPAQRVRSLEHRLRSDFFAETLPRFLHYGDAMSMAHSIETRLPFLDYRLVELCLRLPLGLRGGGARSKEVLRAYLRRRRQPLIADRMDKRGYPTPAAEWLAVGGGAVPRTLLLEPDAMLKNFISPKGVERLIDRQVAGRYATSDLLYALVTCEIWMRMCIAGSQTARV